MNAKPNDCSNTSLYIEGSMRTEKKKITPKAKKLTKLKATEESFDSN